MREKFVYTYIYMTGRWWWHDELICSICEEQFIFSMLRLDIAWRWVCSVPLLLRVTYQATDQLYDGTRVPNQFPECGYMKHEIILITFFQPKPNKSRPKHMHILWYLYHWPLKIFLTHEARGTNEFPCSSCKRDFQHHKRRLIRCMYYS